VFRFLLDAIAIAALATALTVVATSATTPAPSRTPQRTTPSSKPGLGLVAILAVVVGALRRR
jgi:hypothetical protein